MMHRNNELMVTVPAYLLQDLCALASGYTMRAGYFIDKRAVNAAIEILYHEGYESWDDEPLPGAEKWEVFR